MPIPIGAIVGGVQAAGGLLAPIFQGAQNRKNRQFALDMYNRQKQDSLEFWQMQNEYNTPLAQMNRFKAAGLNPNLVYGRGSEGNAGNINLPSQARYVGEAPDVARAGQSVGNALATYYNIRGRRLQNDNLKAQNDLIRAQVGKMKADAALSVLNGQTRDFDLGIKKAARQSLLDEMLNRGAYSQARSQLEWNRSTNESIRSDLMQQQYDLLSKQNPIVLKRFLQGVQLLRDQHQLNMQRLEKLIKETRLVGVSDKTEIGSLLRFIITVSGLDPQLFNK